MKPERYAELREARGLSQAQLAEMLGMTVKSMSYWENGVRKPPIDKLEWLADFYGVSTDYLLGRTDIPNVYTHESVIDGRAGVLYSTQKDLPPAEQEQVEREVQRAVTDGPVVTLQGSTLDSGKLEEFVLRLVRQALEERDTQGNSQS